MREAEKKLREFLDMRALVADIVPLTPDASVRDYFRLRMPHSTAIACIYPDAFVEREQSYLDATNLFLNAGLPVAKILDFEETLGAILIEDLGDRVLRDELARCSRERSDELIDRSISLIAKIQAATELARKTRSIASGLSFDVEKLKWELDFFKTHYFTTLRNGPLPRRSEMALDEEFLQICSFLERRATVLCHRDFHAANLMIDPDGCLRIIDHQDARIGAASYDLVSLLLDRITEPPSADWLAEKRRVLLRARRELGLPILDEQEFAEEFRIQTIQRCLKAAGTFSFQAAVRGKSHFIQFINPMFRIALRAAGRVDQFPALQEILRTESERTF